MHSKPLLLLTCLVVAPLLVACQGDAVSPNAAQIAVEADALQSLRRITLRSQLGDGNELTILGETHALIRGRSVKMPPEVAKLVKSALQLQSRVDATVDEMRAEWSERGYEDIDVAVAKKIHEYRALDSGLAPKKWTRT